MNRKLGFMDFNLYKSIIDEFANFKKKPEIAMNFSGEPTLHKDIYKFAAQIKIVNDHYSSKRRRAN